MTEIHILDYIKAFDSFIEGCKKKIDDHWKDDNIDNHILDYTVGKKYTRVFHQQIGRLDPESKTTIVFCFIDFNNGDVLFPSSWKTPAKGARGNIFDEHNGLKRVHYNGVEYNNHLNNIGKVTIS